ncbi:MAG: diaminopimelate epimerase [Bacteroidota bacterium]
MPTADSRQPTADSRQPTADSRDRPEAGGVPGAMISRTPLVVPFAKMNGAGNDFVVLDNRFLRFSDDELAGLARQTSPRRTGVGADGLLALDDPDAEAADEGVHFRMRYRNADGSLGTMCGNGARCLARFAARAGLGDDTELGVALTFDTDGGRTRADVPDRAASGPVTLHMPPPRDFAKTDLEEAGGPVYRIWTGTEHAVLFVPEADRADVATVGGRLRNDPAFQPTGTNVDVVEVAGPDRLRVRTFEKGVEAETLACGTGALASALVARLTDRLGEGARADVAVEMPGGTLAVGFHLDGPEVRDLTLGGPAETVYEGTLEWTG